MIADSEILTYIFLGLVAFLFIMIFWNVLGGPKKRRRKRRPFEGGNAQDGGYSDAGPAFPARGRRNREDHQDGGGGEDSGADGGGGDGGGGGD